MIGYKKDRVLGAWNVDQLVEYLLLTYMSSRAVYNACSIRGQTRRFWIERWVITSLHRWVDRGKTSADSLGVVGNHAPWQLRGGRWGL